ncbi:MAG: hypothetical protein JWL61_2108, partial [Gemmatimonadetes bacterium]|nr:hypothetical protein [Gemmatimonadota bacterium]
MIARVSLQSRSPRKTATTWLESCELNDELHHRAETVMVPVIARPLGVRDLTGHSG